MLVKESFVSCRYSGACIPRGLAARLRANTVPLAHLREQLAKQGFAQVSFLLRRAITGQELMERYSSVVSVLKITHEIPAMRCSRSDALWQVVWDRFLFECR